MKYFWVWVLLCLRGLIQNYPNSEEATTQLISLSLFTGVKSDEVDIDIDIEIGHIF